MLAQKMNDEEHVKRQNHNPVLESDLLSVQYGKRIESNTFEYPDNTV